MNFTQFLKTDRMLNETCVFEDAEPVVVGYGTFESCHLGYLPLVAELVKLGEQYDAEPILVILQKDTVAEYNTLPTVLQALTESFPFLKVQVEENLVDPLYRFSQNGKKCVAMVGEPTSLYEAQYHYEKLYQEEAHEVVLHLGSYKRATKEAAYSGDFNKFRASIVECSFEVAHKMFEQIREAHNG